MASHQEIEDYANFKNLTFVTRGESLQVVSKPGLPAWNTLLPAESLLIETLPNDIEGKLLLLGCHHGALAIHLSRRFPPATRLTAADSNYLALACTQRSLELNHLTGVNLQSIHTLADAQADILILLPPRGRAQGRAMLCIAAKALRPGGRLYIAGANDEGIQSLIKDAASLFGECEVLAYRKGSRAALSHRPTNLGNPDWANEPGIKPGSFLVLQMRLPDERSFTIYSLPGVFSYAHLDPGSALLLENMDLILAGLPENAHIIDVGCGYGIIGMAAARSMPKAQVSLVDIDLSAVTCTHKNLASNEIFNAQSFPSDLLDACHNQRYHLILSNPPFHAGKQVRYDATEALIQQAQTHLLPGGRLILVANRFIRYEKTMQAFLSNVEILAENQQFHLLKGSVDHPIRKRGE